MIQKVLGVFLTELRMLWGPNQARFKRIVYDLSRSIMELNGEKRFILFVGFSKAGKQTLIEHDPFYRQCFVVSTDVIHKRINRMFPWLRDNQTIHDTAYWPRQWLARKVRTELLRIGFQSGVAIVNDSCNLVRSERSKLMRLAKRHQYRTEIVWVQCREDTLRQRLTVADEENEKKGRPRAWVDLYQGIQKARFEPPTADEADRLTTRSGEEALY